MHAELPELAEPFSWQKSGDVVWISFSHGGAAGAFSTRQGGVSYGPYSSLNLGKYTDDLAGSVMENHVRFKKAVQRKGSNMVISIQVHEANVVDARMGFSDPSSRPEADGMFTNERFQTLTVLTADCLPVALMARDAVAIIHCGWRGIGIGIVSSGVRALTDALGARSDDISAFIGPGIGQCCYEVGSEVQSAMSALGHGDGFFEGRNLDLAGVVSEELIASGVPLGQVHAVDVCTGCNEAYFFSHRRDNGVTGRQGGSVWLV